jgi:AraC-like DNA-binding protein
MAERSNNRIDFQNIPQAVGAMAKEFARGEISHKHRHKRAQLLYAVKGLFEVKVAHSLFLIPPQHAIWLPPNIEHQVRFRMASSVRTLYIGPDAIPPSAPDLPRVVHVSSLLRELILRMVSLPINYDKGSHADNLATVALAEISWEADDHLHMPLAKDKRIARIQHSLTKNPGDNRTLSDWAKSAGASTRTLARLFQDEYGTSFVNWRQQLRIIAALPKLAAGEPVINVALDLGYETPGAFTAMFHRITGVLPSKYFGHG